jgi:peptidoglycan/LPS O-acetylase OafA/YrhL
MDLFSRPTVHLAVLDGLRAVAVLKIILRHTRLHARGLIETQGVSEWVARLGRYGVDLSFLLTGFLIAHLLFAEYERAGRLAIRNFYVRRTLRIFPAYYVTLCLLLVVICAGRWSGLFLGTPKQVLLPQAWIHVFYLNNYIRTDYMYWSWSLATQEQFYLLLPWFLLWVLFRLPHRGRIGLLLALFLLPLWCRWHASVIQGVQHAALSDVFPGRPAAWFMALYVPLHLHADPLILGVLCAYLYRWSPSTREFIARFHHWLVLGGVTLTLAFLWSIRPSSAVAYPYVFGITLIAVLHAAIMMGALGQGNVIGRALAARCLYPIARVSYGMYLLSPLVSMVVLDAVGRGAWLRSLPPPFSLLLLFVMNVVCAYIAALVLFLFVERPCLSLKDRFAHGGVFSRA